MTKAELNRDIKRLYNKVDSLQGDVFYSFIENEGKKEFNRLYYADSSADALTKDNLLRMMSLNRRYHFVPSHTFYISSKF
jgi:hypothetical protein